MKHEPEMRLVKRDGKLHMEPVGPTRAETFIKDVQRGLEELAAGPRQMQSQLARTEQLRLEGIRHEARLRAEAIAREEAMLAEMATMRQSVLDANARAQAAEEREQQSQAASDARERQMLKVTKVSVAIAAIGIIIAIFAIVVAIMLAP